MIEASEGLLAPANYGMARVRHVEEKKLRLAAKKAQEAAESERPAVAGESGVVRFVTDGAGSKRACRWRNDAENLAAMR